jgi:hypothetical protein
MTLQKESDSLSKNSDSSNQFPGTDRNSIPDLREQRLAEKIESLGLYYSEYNGPFYIPNSSGGWIKVSENGAKRYLRWQGFSGTKEPRLISEIDEVLLLATRTGSVSYAGPLAGRRAGPFVHQGDLILVTNSPTLINPRPGKFLIIQRFLERLLLGQLAHFYGWLKIAIESLYSSQARQGQALVLAGPNDCGKSVLQNLIITPILGGRSAKPYQYMSGQTPFNNHLFGAEHQLIEDEIPSTDIRARRNFGTIIKQFTATEEILCHGKNKQALTLAPFWRLTISCNIEPEYLMILPPLDESLMDKLMLFKAHPGPMPMRTRTDEERLRFRNAIERELPAFVAFLLNWKLPLAIRSQRYGVREYHHPEIVKAIGELSPEERLKQLIDDAASLFDQGTASTDNDASRPHATTTAPGTAPSPWEGTPTQLEEQLRLNYPWTMKVEVDRLLKTSNTCAIYLGRLTRRYPQRFESIDRKKNIHHYRIAPPGTTLPQPRKKAPRRPGKMPPGAGLGSKPGTKSH